MQIEILGGPHDGETRTAADGETVVEEPLAAVVPVQTPHGPGYRQVVASLSIEHRPDRARPVAVWREPRWDETEETKP